ncbi:MAG: ATP-binding protein [Cyanothece sp. SIO2G6]|nr:ATP-binding protein [Cyanothece sp. SIO2G6]
MSSFLNPKDPSTAQSFSIALNHHIDSLTLLSQWVETVGQTMQLSKALCFKLNLVLEEIVTNVIQHGSQVDDKNSHKNDDQSRDTSKDTSTITVSVHYGPHQICLSVSDRGIPFNPLQDHNVQLPANLENAKIGGLGIHLITSYTHTINYERRGDRNILTMTFLRTENSVET